MMPTDAEFRIRCDCGKEHRVSARSAGSSLDCPCGRRVEIPSLSELRRQAGEPAYSVKARWILGDMLVKKQLPIRTRCAHCERETDQSIRVAVECERVWQKKSYDSPTNVAIVLIFGVWGWLFLRRRDERELGDDVMLVLPIRLCEVCRRDMGSVRSSPYLNVFAVGLIVAGIVSAIAVSIWCLALVGVALLVRLTDAWIHSRNRAQLHRLLRIEPLYAQLLDDYPKAIVSWNG
jgi:hypothetical protein